MQAPAELNHDQLQAYLYHLAYERKLSSSTCNVAINALRLYYQLVEGIPREQLNLMLPRPRNGWRLPEVLSVEGVERLIGGCTEATPGAPAALAPSTMSLQSPFSLTHVMPHQHQTRTGLFFSQPKTAIRKAISLRHSNTSRSDSPSTNE